MRRGSLVKTDEYGYGIVIEKYDGSGNMNNIFVLHTNETAKRLNISNDASTYNLYISSPYGFLTSGDLVSYANYITCIDLRNIQEIDSKHHEFKDARFAIRRLLSMNIAKRNKLVKKLLSL